VTNDNETIVRQQSLGVEFEDKVVFPKFFIVVVERAY